MVSCNFDQLSYYRSFRASDSCYFPQLVFWSVVNFGQLVFCSVGSFVDVVYVTCNIGNLIFVFLKGIILVSYDFYHNTIPSQSYSIHLCAPALIKLCV